MHQCKSGSGYDYIGCQTNVLLIVVVNTQKIIDSWMEIYEAGNLGPPAYHLGWDCWQGGEYWCTCSSTHIKEALVKVEEILGKLYDIQGYKIKVNTKKCEKNPIWKDLHPEMDESDLLDKNIHIAYQHLIKNLHSCVQLEGLIFSFLFVPLFSKGAAKGGWKSIWLFERFSWHADQDWSLGPKGFSCDVNSRCIFQGAIPWCIWRIGLAVSCPFWAANQLFNYLWSWWCPWWKNLGW